MPAERKRSNNSAGMDSRIFPMEGAGETRTPMAWQQRNLNYQQQQHNQQQQQQHQQQQQSQQIYHASTIGYDRERPKRGKTFATLILQHLTAIRKKIQKQIIFRIQILLHFTINLTLFTKGNKYLQNFK
jgi:hypothetical protein